jgi:hypothetical protein
MAGWSWKIIRVLLTCAARYPIQIVARMYILFVSEGDGLGDVAEKRCMK